MTFRPLLAPALVLAALALPPPARAAVHGGIEIGSTGVRAVALDVKGGADGFDARVLLTATENTALVTDLGKSGRFGDEALAATAKAVARFAALMQKEHGVAPASLHVVASSGLFAPLVGKDDAVKANQEVLARAVRDTCGLTVAFVDAKREAELSIAGAVPANFAAASLLVDVGGGNSKGGGRNNDRTFFTFSVPYGTRSFTDLVKAKGDSKPFAEAAPALREEVVGPAVKKQVEARPELRKRERIYLSGGSAWALATFTRPADRAAYVPLTADEIETYRRKLTSGDYPAAEVPAGTDDVVRAAAEKEVATVKKVFKPEQLAAGAEVLKALSDGLDFAGKKVFFARDAQHAWILAFVAEKAGAER